MGCELPYKLTIYQTLEQPPPKICREQRIGILTTLFAYFTEFSTQNELYEATSNGLPLFLQDAYDDNERALIFKLGLFLVKIKLLVFLLFL